MPRNVTGTASAEFFVLIGPSDKIEAKFISGSDALKGAQKILRSTKFNLKFLDDITHDYYALESLATNMPAAPAETRTPNLYRATKIAHQSAGGRMTKGANSPREKPCPANKQNEPLDSGRPSHGRRCNFGANPAGIQSEVHTSRRANIGSTFVARLAGK
jgi:hypothetical protein